MKDATPSRSPSAEVRTCRVVQDDDELALHHRIRRQVFVEEQRLFVDNDRDGHDEDPLTVHVLGHVDGVAAGTVRLYPLDGTLWKGDRLAVLSDQRKSGIGGPLVRFAVATAAAGGGRRMEATVQAVNTRFFLHLGWSLASEPVDFLGVPHQPMTISF